MDHLGGCELLRRRRLHLQVRIDLHDDDDHPSDHDHDDVPTDDDQLDHDQAPTTSSTTTTTTTTLPTTPGKVLDLPRSRGPVVAAYWAKFPDAVKAGWDKDTFFPVGAFWAYWPGGNGADAHADVQWDKDHGINFYTARQRRPGRLRAARRRRHVMDRRARLDQRPGDLRRDRVARHVPGGRGRRAVQRVGRQGVARQRLRDQTPRAATPGKAIFNNYTGDGPFRPGTPTRSARGT